MFEITAKRPSSERPSHWMIPQHSNRSVLVLSRFIGYCSVTNLFMSLKRDGEYTPGINCLRGTARRYVDKDLVITLAGDQ